jgi:hypothetical protein
VICTVQHPFVGFLLSQLCDNIYMHCNYFISSQRIESSFFFPHNVGETESQMIFVLLIVS